MTSDYDLIAPFYDTEHERFMEDVDLYRNFAELASGPLLELACGSGRLLVPLARAGYEVVGVDSSAKMLELARERLEKMKLTDRCTLVQQDIGALHLERQFRMAFVALGSFAHVIS